MTPPPGFARRPSQVEMVEAHLPVVVDHIRGLDEGWFMPVATFPAAAGLSKEGVRGPQSNHALSIPLPSNGQPDPDISRIFGPDVCAILPQDLDVPFSPTHPQRFANLLFTDNYLAWVGSSVLEDKIQGRTVLRHDRAFASDPVLKQSVAAYADRALNPEEKPSRLEMDSRANLIAMHLLLNHAGVATDAPRLKVSGGLSGWQARRTTEYLRANMTKDVSVTELAALAGLSMFHFARAFKQTVGVPPHRYQLRLRLERAQTLLATTDMAITDVAAAVGYDTPQTLARLFRREIGMSPGQYRREKR